MTETQITFEAIKSLYNQLRHDYKKICCKEFGKPSDKIDKNGYPITERRLWAQKALKELNEIYDHACLYYDSSPLMTIEEEQEELDIIYQSLLHCKIDLGKV